jgi:hypothetical protein
LTGRSLFPRRLLGVASVAVAALAAGPAGFRPGDPPLINALSLDTLRAKAPGVAAPGLRSALELGAVIPGYLSSRGLPPIDGHLTVTDTGLVFHSSQGSVTILPLVGPLRVSAGRQWRPSAVSLAYVDDHQGRPIYFFRIDAGVFETDTPGPLLDVAAHPGWLDSLGTTAWTVDRPLVDAADTVAVRKTTRDIAAGSYADTLYALFGHPRAPIGLIGRRGRMAGRLGEYIASRDSLALDPGRMTGGAQLRHALAHELGHRWQTMAPAQVTLLWLGVPPIRDSKRYGHGDVSEHQAEAVAFAVHFLQTTVSSPSPATTSLTLLDHYELLVPGTRTMVRYLSLQPIYRNHPLRSLLTTGQVE